MSAPNLQPTPANPNSSTPQTTAILTPPVIPTPNPTDLDSLCRKLSLTALIAAPVLLALPPRKLDLYTFSLCSAFVVAANYQTETRTGRSILMHLGRRYVEEDKARRRIGEEDGLGVGSVMEGRGTQLQRKLAAQRWGHSAWDAWGHKEGAWLGADGKARAAKVVFPGTQNRGMRDTRSAVEEGDSESKEGVDGMVHKVWLGGEGENWKAKRMREEREAAEDGKGIGDMIAEQIWDVWNWGQAEGTDEEERA